VPIPRAKRNSPVPDQPTKIGVPGENIRSRRVLLSESHDRQNRKTGRDEDIRGRAFFPSGISHSHKGRRKPKAHSKGSGVAVYHWHRVARGGVFLIAVNEIEDTLACGVVAA